MYYMKNADILFLLSVVVVQSVYPVGSTHYLPDTSGIDGQLTANLHVDHFFSLWLVFHNDDVQITDKQFIIFAPLNHATKENNHLRNPEQVKQLLLNHVVYDQDIDVNNLTEPTNLTTLGGHVITLAHNNLKLYANNALVLEPNVKVPKGKLMVVDNYVFNVNNAEKIIPAESLTTITVNDDKPVLNNSFVDNIHQVLSFLKSGVRVFQHFLSKSNVTKLLNKEQEYTVLIPTDHAFQRWHPIDWGFYPFSVPEFTEDIIRNHFIIGNLRQTDIQPELEMKTLAGRIVTFSVIPHLAVNGVQIVKGDTPVKGGTIMFINEVLFVTESVVSRLHQQHRDKETPPLLAFPWFGAQFLSHAFLALERDNRFSHITRFLNLADLAPHVSGTGYTFFVPTDEGFERSDLSHMPDNYLSSGNGLKLLLNHFVRKRLYVRDLQNNTSFNTLGNQTIVITREGDNIYANEARIVETEVFVYNLGTMYYVDRALFKSADQKEASALVNSTLPSPVATTGIKHSVHSESVPEEIIEEVGVLPDLLETFDEKLDMSKYKANNSNIVKNNLDDLVVNSTNVSDEQSSTVEVKTNTTSPIK